MGKPGGPLRVTFAVGALAFACLAGASPAAAAQINYPWCTSGAGQEYGSVNCGFSTFEQCLATARGNGQSCGPNPFYEPKAAPAARKKAPRQGKASQREGEPRGDVTSRPARE